MKGAKGWNFFLFLPLNEKKGSKLRNVFGILTYIDRSGFERDRE